MRAVEPNDLPVGSITDETASNYRVLVYKRSQEDAGIHTLEIGDWKTYLGFNEHKNKNIATFVGIDDEEYTWESDEDLEPPAEGTVVDRLESIALQAGVSSTTTPYDPSYTPLRTRIETVEDDINNSSDGLKKRVTDTESSIEELQESVGNPSGSGGTLTNRITTLENKVGDTGTADTLEYIVRNSTDGLVTKVSDLETDVGTLQTDVGNLQTDVINIQTTLTSVYTVKGDITGVDNPNDTTSITTTSGSISLSSLKNGWVYNVNPTGSTTSIVMTISGTSYTFYKDQNIVWIKEGSSGHFDPLSTGINVDKVDEINDKMNEIYPIVKAGFSKKAANWSSDSAGEELNGAYIICGVHTTNNPGGGTTITTCIFTANFNNGILYGMLGPAELTDNAFNSVFIQKNDNSISVIDANTSVSLTKIGD